MEIWILFFVFFKIGLVCYGGGYAMMSFLQDYVVEYDWTSIKEFTEIVAISQITPGPIAVNLATFVGFKKFGVVGAFWATLGITLPCLIVCIIISKFFKKFSETKAIKSIMYGIKPASAGLILASAFKIGSLEIFSGTISDGLLNYIKTFQIIPTLICIITFFVLLKTKLNPIFAVLIAGVVGIFIF